MLPCQFQTMTHYFQSIDYKIQFLAKMKHLIMKTIDALVTNVAEYIQQLFYGYFLFLNCPLKIW